MFLKEKQSKKLKKSSVERLKTYTSIHDLPQRIWNDIHSTGDLNLLVKKGRANEVQLNELWEKIFDQFLDEIGFSTDYRNVLEKQKSILMLKCDLITTGDKSLKTIIQIEEEELEQMTSGGNGFSYMESIIHISKFAGHRIDAQKITVAEYHSWLEVMKKSVKNVN